MKTLIIAEKPSVAQDIAVAFGGDFRKERLGKSGFLENDEFVISSAVGHLATLVCPKDEDPGNDLNRLPAIPKRFSLGAIERTKDQLDLLGKLLHRNDVGLVINACDAGREGELIFRYIYAYTNCSKNVARMWLQSMTHASILGAYAEMRPSSEYDSLFYAAQSRSEADWLIGINGTRAVKILHQIKEGKNTNHSVGRVQTPVLNIVVERDENIRTFVAKEYSEIHAKFSDGNRQYSSKWVNTRFSTDPANRDAKAERFFNKADAAAMIARIQGQPVRSVSDEFIEMSTPPPKLFDLTTLQREANKKLGFSAMHTLECAQKLYDQKIITYPRTDADALPEDYVETAKATLERIGQNNGPYSQYALAAIDSVKPDKRIFNNKKISDHFAVIPTGAVASISGDEAKLYDLIIRRFVSAFLPDAVYHRTVRTTIINSETFRTSGKVLAKEGWLIVYGQEVKDDDAPDDESGALCKLSPGETLPVLALNLANLKTKAPVPFTEATLLTAMEMAGQDIEDEDEREAMKGKGLGTPATRAATIEKLLDPTVGYLSRESKKNKATTKEIRSTLKGRELVSFLRENSLTSLLSAKTTGEWEYKFKLMEQNKFARSEFMKSIEEATRSIVDKARQCVNALPAEKRQLMEPSKIALACPKCSAQLAIDFRMASCSCGFKLWRDIAGLRLTDDQLETLVTARSLPKLTGFMSATKKKPFSAAVKLADNLSGKVDFIF